MAIERWANSDDDQSLPVIMKASMAELRAVTAGSSAAFRGVLGVVSAFRWEMLTGAGLDGC